MRLEIADNSVSAILEALSSKAWSKPVINAGESPFLLPPRPVAMPATEYSLWQVLREMYEHARVWAPGFDIPFFVPPVHITALRHEAGYFSVDEESYASIAVSSSFLSSSDATLLILAHEACHHILLQTGISYAFRNDTKLNERITDLTMFVCGFGEIAKRGYSVVRRHRDTFVSVHLGYLNPIEYQQAYEFVITKRRRHKLPGVPGRSTVFEKIRAWVHKSVISRQRPDSNNMLLESVIRETERRERVRDRNQHRRD